MATVYEINKGINRSIEFKGIKAQYIIYLCIGLVGLLLLFAIMYIIGINVYVCLVIIIPSGAFLFLTVTRLSKKYGEHGLMKKAAQKRLPSYVSSNKRKIFLDLRKNDNGKEKKNY